MKLADDLAQGFFIEYLNRDPEYLDVAEYVMENTDNDDENEELTARVYTQVVDAFEYIREQLNESL
jgi:hypothetical protein